MSTNYSKPFLTYEQQIDRLQNHYGLEIPDRDLAINLLKTISYYDLINGYKECFMFNEKFQAGVNIIDLFIFKMFDKNIQNILFKYSVYVENTFKTKLAYMLAKNHGVHIDQYLDVNIMSYPKYKKRLKKRNLTLDTIRNISNNYNSDMPTLHYIENHNHVPPWILFKNTNFNDVIDLYSYLKFHDKLEIANDYLKSDKVSDHDKIELLKTTISIVRRFRNKIAHNAKVFNHTTHLNKINISCIIKFLPPNYVHGNDLKNNYGINDLFSMINSLVLLLDNNFLVLSLIDEIRAIFDRENPAFTTTINRYIDAAHLPKDINRRLDVLYKSVYDSTFKDI